MGFIIDPSEDQTAKGTKDFRALGSKKSLRSKDKIAALQGKVRTIIHDGVPGRPQPEMGRKHLNSTHDILVQRQLTPGRPAVRQLAPMNRFQHLLEDRDDLPGGSGDWVDRKTDKWFASNAGGKKLKTRQADAKDNRAPEVENRAPNDRSRKKLPMVGRKRVQGRRLKGQRGSKRKRPRMIRQGQYRDKTRPKVRRKNKRRKKRPRRRKSNRKQKRRRQMMNNRLNRNRYDSSGDVGSQDGASNVKLRTGGHHKKHGGHYKPHKKIGHKPIKKGGHKPIKMGGGMGHKGLGGLIGG